MNPLVIIPTYISSGRRPKETNVIGIYDHATTITQEGELPRCLDSLRKVEGLGQIVILVAADSGLENKAMLKVQNTADHFPDLSIAVVGASEANLVQQRMDQLNLGKHTKEIGLTGYSAIKNLGLVIANVMGFDAVVFIDDDEVVEDPKFLINGIYGLGKLTRKGVPILAKTGYYLNAQGSYFSNKKTPWYDKFWQQSAAFNEWIGQAMTGPRLSHSKHVCGGCLALHKEAFKRLSFDPWITRGEDLDYMLDLRMYGSDIWFDNKWVLRHLPPKTPSEGRRFHQNIFRWLYEYRKMEYSRTQIDLLQVKPGSLEPYPGPFIEPGVKKRVRRTALLRSFARPDKAAYRKAAAAAQTEAEDYAMRCCAKYFEFQFVWPEIMTRIEGDRILKNALIESAQRRRDEANEARAIGAGARGGARGSAAQPAATPRAAVELQPDQAAQAQPAQSAMRTTSLDPGVTTEIHLNLGD